MKTPSIFEKSLLCSYFGIISIPFVRTSAPSAVYDSAAQRELIQGLLLWCEVMGFALVTGASGVGKSLCIRRFAADIDESRFAVFRVPYLTSTVYGFLRLLNRALGLDFRQHTTDLFHAAQQFLVTYKSETGKHPILVIDDAEGLMPPIADVLCRLSIYDGDAEDRFSILISGIENLLEVLLLHIIEPLRSRFSYVHSLKPFGLEDTQHYMAHHLQMAAAPPDLFTEDAVRLIFQTSQGKPRTINQLAISALINATIKRHTKIDAVQIRSLLTANPLFKSNQEF